MRARPVYLRSAFWWSAFAVWFAVLVVLSSFSAPDLGGPEIPHFDKFLHLGFFSAGGFCMMLGLFFAARHRVDSAGVRFAIVVVSISLIGVFDEWHQTFTAGREGASVGDWIADMLGGAVGGAAGFVFPRWLRTQGRSSLHLPEP